MLNALPIRAASLVLMGILCLGARMELRGQRYSYDAAGRLVRVTYAEGGGLLYSYDEADNMTAVMPLNTLPAPTGVDVTRLSPTSAQVTWQGDSSATGYRIERRNVNSDAWQEVATVAAGTNVFVDANLESGVDYEYRVSALNEDGDSAPSEAAGFSGPPRPSISQNGVTNGASFEQGRPVAPGSIISIFGDNLGVRVTGSGVETITALAPSVPLTTKLADYTVLFGEVEAPLFFVGGQNVGGQDQPQFTGQINAQVPWEVPLGESEVRVVFHPDAADEQVSESAPVQVAAVAPALFTFDFGPGRAVALNVKVNEDDGVIDGSIAQVAGAFPGAVSQPAKLGGVVTLYANGLGPTEPEGETGDNSLDALRGVTIPPRVFVGDTEAEILFAGLTPQFVGLYQINIILPLAVVPGDEVPVIIMQGGAMSRSDVTIAVQP